MIPQDPRDTLRIGFKSGACIEVKVENAHELVKSIDRTWDTARHDRQVIGGTLVALPCVEFLQVMPRAYPQVDLQTYRMPNCTPPQAQAQAQARTLNEAEFTA